MSQSPGIMSVGRSLPKHYADQETLIDGLRRLWVKQHFNPARVDDLHRAVKVAGRYLALPIEAYEHLETFQQHNDAWIRIALEIGGATDFGDLA